MLRHVRAPAEPAPRANGILRNVSMLSGGLVTTSILAILWTLVVPRVLGPHGMGLIVMAWSAAGIILAVGGLGLRTLLVREIAGEPERTPRLLGAGMILRAAAILPCVAITAAYVYFGHFSGEHALVLYLAAGVAICTLFLELYLAAFQAIERMEYLAYADVLNKTLLTGIGIALVLVGFRATTLVGLMLGAAALVLVLMVRWARPFFSIDWAIELSEIRALTVRSLPYWTYGLFFNFYLWMDATMLAVMAPTAVVGWYGGPTKLFGTLMFVPAILGTAWLPRMVAAFKESPGRLKEVGRTATEQILILGLPASVGAALIAGPLVRLLYGSAFAPAVPVFAILALTVVPTYFNIVANLFLVATNRQLIWTKALAFASVVNLALNFVLIRAFQDHVGNGAIGAALSFLLTELTLVVIAVAVTHPYIHRQSLSRVGRSGLATVGMAIVVQALGSFGLVAQVTSGVLSYVGLSLLLRVPTTQEIREVERLLNRLALRLRLR